METNSLLQASSINELAVIKLPQKYLHNGYVYFVFSFYFYSLRKLDIWACWQCLVSFTWQELTFHGAHSMLMKQERKSHYRVILSNVNATGTLLFTPLRLQTLIPVSFRKIEKINNIHIF